MDLPSSPRATNTIRQRVEAASCLMVIVAVSVAPMVISAARTWLARRRDARTQEPVTTPPVDSGV